MRVQCAYLFAISVLAVHVSAQMNSSPPNPDYFLPISSVGSNDSGVAVPFYGCQDNGATIQQLSFWANDQWMRGVGAKLSDGREVFFGCLNVTGNQTGQTGCSNLPSIRNSNFTFQRGERISSLSMWPGPNVQGQANKRAGAISFNTSAGRSFDFGMTITRQNETKIDVGQGIPCGIAPKAGADIDSMGFIFLRNITASALQNMQYSGVAASSSGGVSSDTAPLTESASQLVLSNQTYNNSGQTTSLVASFNSQAALGSSSQWTYVMGLDSYVMAPVNGSTPQLTDESNSTYIRWTLGSPRMHDRNESTETQEAWNYTVTVGPRGSSQILATALQGNITATYTAKLNITLDSGATVSTPVSGLYLGLSSTPVNVKVVELAAAVPQAGQNSSNSGHSNTVPWVVGILIGILVGLILAVLLAWAFAIIMQKRNKKTQESQSAHTTDNQQRPQPRGCLPTLQIPALFRKTGAVAPEDLQKDVELGNAGGKNKWIVEEEDSKLSPVTAVPVPKAAQEAKADTPLRGELPETEGQHVLPYNMFRRLRLDTIRRNLKLEKENEDSTPVKASEAKLAKIEGNLSNPPSGASTPRTIPEMSTNNQRTSVPSETGAESIEAHSEPETSTFQGGPRQDDDKAALFADSSEDEKQDVAQAAARRQHVREQVAQRMAERRPTPPRQPHPSRASKSPALARGDNLMNKISSQIASYRSGKQAPMSNPSGLDRRELNEDAIRHEGADLKLGAGYTPPENSKTLEKKVVRHGDDRIRLGVKYHTQGRNE